MEYKIDEVGLQKHREQTVEEILELLKEHDRVACVRFTGYGKSYHVLHQVLERISGKVLILVPNLYLLQMYENTYEGKKHISVHTYQLLQSRYLDYHNPDYDYIICDECHHLGNNTWSKTLDNIQQSCGAKILGLTATPIRWDGINIVTSFFKGIEVEPLDLLSGYENNFIPQTKYIVACAQLDKKVETIISSIDKYKIKNLINIPDILNKHLYDQMTKNNMKVLLFVPRVKNIEDGKHYAKKWFEIAFRDKEVNIYSMDSSTSDRLNRDALNRFINNNKNNSIDVMVSVDKICEGLHLPNINVVIMLRKTVSPVKYLQQFGRGINQLHPVIFDFVNNCTHLYVNLKEVVKSANSGLCVPQEPMGLFNDKLILIDETIAIKEVLKKYTGKLFAKVIPYELRYQIAQDIDLTLKECAEKYGVSVPTVYNIRKQFDLIKHTRDYQQILEDNYDDVVSLLGKIPRNKIGLKYGVTGPAVDTFVSKHPELENTRVAPPVKIIDSILDEFVLLSNKGLSRLQIKTKLDLSDIQYNAYLRKTLGMRNNKKNGLPEKVKSYLFLNASPDVSIDDLVIGLGGRYSESKIRRFMRNNKLPYKYNKLPKVIEKSDEVIMIEAYKRLGSLYATHKETGFHKATIKKAVIKAGLSVKEPIRPHNPLTEQEMQSILNDYNAGVGVSALTKNYHRALGTIKQILADAGVLKTKSTNK